MEGQKNNQTPEEAIEQLKKVTPEQYKQMSNKEKADHLTQVASLELRNVFHHVMLINELLTKQIEMLELINEKNSKKNG